VGHAASVVKDPLLRRWEARQNLREALGLLADPLFPVMDVPHLEIDHLPALQRRADYIPCLLLPEGARVRAAVNAGLVVAIVEVVTQAHARGRRFSFRDRRRLLENFFDTGTRGLLERLDGKSTFCRDLLPLIADQAIASLRGFLLADPAWGGYWPFVGGSFPLLPDFGRICEMGGALDRVRVFRTGPLRHDFLHNPANLP
jgi:hypothetical protein